MTKGAGERPAPGSTAEPGGGQGSRQGRQEGVLGEQQGVGRLCDQSEPCGLKEGKEGAKAAGLDGGRGAGR